MGFPKDNDGDELARGELVLGRGFEGGRGLTADIDATRVEFPAGRGF